MRHLPLCAHGIFGLFSAPRQTFRTLLLSPSCIKGEETEYIPSLGKEQPSLRHYHRIVSVAQQLLTHGVRVAAVVERAHTDVNQIITRVVNRRYGVSAPAQRANQHVGIFAV